MARPTNRTTRVQGKPTSTVVESISIEPTEQEAAPPASRSSSRVPTSRSSRVRSGKAPSTAQAPAVVEGEDDGDLPVGSRTSARLATGRHSSRRLATKSITSGRSPVIETAEKAAERRGAVRGGLFILAGFIGLAVIVGLLYTLFLKDDPVESKGRSSLAEAERSLKTAQTHLENRQPDAARREVAAAKAAFSGVPVLTQLAQRRSEMKRELEAILPKIEQVSRDVQVDTNKRLLQARLAKLGSSDVSDGEVARLEADCQAFIRNPVDPTTGPDAESAKMYGSSVMEIQSRTGTVQAELRRRLDQATTGQVRKVQGEIEPLVKQERFGAAVERINAATKQFPGAKFKETQTYVENAAESAWNSVNSFVELKTKDARAPEATPQGKEANYQAIRERLDTVINTWGLELYVNKAKELRKEY